METRPPALIESIVSRLIPPACREHVMGDLHERYRSPLQYIGDAFRSVPFVVASQIRRNFSIELFMAEACALYIAFAVAAMTRGPGYLYDQHELLRTGVMIAITLGVMRVLDAYTPPTGASPRDIVAKCGLTVSASYVIGFISKKLGFGFAPERWLMTGAAFTGFMLLYFVQIWFAKYNNGASLNPAGQTAALDELRRQSQREHRKAWHLNFAWFWAAVLVLLANNNWMTMWRGVGYSVVFLMIVVGLLLAFGRYKEGKAGREYRLSETSIVAQDRYRLSLVGKRDGLRLWSGAGIPWSLGGPPVFLLYLIAFPFFLLLLGVIGGRQLEWIRFTGISLALFIALSLAWIYVRRVNDRAARTIQNEIDALDDSRKHPSAK